MIAKASSYPDLMVFPSHIENMGKAMATTSTLVAHWRSHWLVWLAYVKDKEKEDNEEDIDNEYQYC